MYVSHMPQVHAFIHEKHQGTKAAVNKLRQDLLPLHLAEVPMQARNLHAACLQLELRILQMHDGKGHIRLALSGLKVCRASVVCLLVPFNSRTALRRPEQYLQTLLEVHEDQAPLCVQCVDGAAKEIDAAMGWCDHIHVPDVRRQRRACLSAGGLLQLRACVLQTGQMS